MLEFMRWSWKVPTAFQVWKYRQSNIGVSFFLNQMFKIFYLLLEIYLMFMEWVQTFEDKTKLKYLDEAHFVPRFLNNTKVWGLKAKRIYSRVNSLSEKSSSVTLIVSLNSEKPLFLDLRIENNDQVFLFGLTFSYLLLLSLTFSYLILSYLTCKYGCLFYSGRFWMCFFRLVRMDFY
jgi:hypothetical protein